MTEYTVTFKQTVKVTFPFEMDSDTDVIEKAMRHIDIRDQDYYTVDEVNDVK